MLWRHTTNLGDSLQCICQIAHENGSRRYILPAMRREFVRQRRGVAIQSDKINGLNARQMLTHGKEESISVRSSKYIQKMLSLLLCPKFISLQTCRHVIFVPIKWTLKYCWHSYGLTLFIGLYKWRLKLLSLFFFPKIFCTWDLELSYDNFCFNWYSTHAYTNVRHCLKFLIQSCISPSSL